MQITTTLAPRPSSRSTLRVRCVSTPVRPASAPTTSKSRPYRLTPYGGWAAEARGLDLKQELPPDVVQQIIEDTNKYRLVIFKDQDVISGQRHAEIASWFGTVDSSIIQHPKADHPCVFKLANDEDEGWSTIEADWWHVDGMFREAPHSHTLYHIIHASHKGTTNFMPLKELVDRLPSDVRGRWERLWVVNPVPINLLGEKEPRIHPLMYKHPVTGDMIPLFHLAPLSMETFIWDKGTPKERRTDKDESAALRAELEHYLENENQDLLLRHLWQPGDFGLSDNLALGHIATKETRLPRDQIGLRVLHRISVEGKYRPSKTELDPL